MWYKNYLLLSPISHANVVYVNKSALPNGDGNSWETAFTDLQLAIEIAHVTAGKDQVWVAEGIYRTDDNDHCAWGSEHSFHAHGGVSVYGAFLGWETSLEERAGSRGATVIAQASNKIGVGSIVLLCNDDTKNGDHAALDGDFLVDGFTFSNPGTSLVRQGILLFTTSIPLDYSVRNCDLNGLARNSVGAAILCYVRYTPSVNLYISDSIFTECITTVYGGVISPTYGTTAFIDRIIVQDSDTREACAVYSYRGVKATVTNSLFRRNTCGRSGIISTQSYMSLDVVNCTLVDNNVTGTTHPTYTALIFCANSGANTLRVINSVFRRNYVITGKDIWASAYTTHHAVNNYHEGAIVATFAVNRGNSTADPLLDTDNRPTPGSPAIGYGDVTYITTESDLDDNPRTLNGVVDCGCYQQT